jgi:hypothetical protein
MSRPSVSSATWAFDVRCAVFDVQQDQSSNHHHRRYRADNSGRRFP